MFGMVHTFLSDELFFLRYGILAPSLVSPCLRFLFPQIYSR